MYVFNANSYLFIVIDDFCLFILNRCWIIFRVKQCVTILLTNKQKSIFFFAILFKFSSKAKKSNIC